MVIKNNYVSRKVFDKYRIKSTSKKNNLSDKDMITLLATSWPSLTIAASKIAKDSISK